MLTLNSGRCRYTITAFFLVALTGCGGSGDGDATTPIIDAPSSSHTPPLSSVLKGKLIDTFVSGVQYKTESISGITNESGEFEYRKGEKISFSIGEIKLNSKSGIEAQAIITPLDLSESSNVDATKSINIMQLLQSLDQDQLVDNGIQISANLREKAANKRIDFDSSRFSEDIITLVEDLSDGNAQVVNANDALSHFYETMATMVADANNSDITEAMLPKFSQAVYNLDSEQGKTSTINVKLNLNPGSASVTIKLGEQQVLQMIASDDQLNWHLDQTLARDSKVTFMLKSKSGVLLSSSTETLNPTIIIDSDSDGVPDESDAFPLNANETHDFDGDGIGNNADIDDDNDGLLDNQDMFPFNASKMRAFEVIWPIDDSVLMGAFKDTNSSTDTIGGIVEFRAPRDTSEIMRYKLFWFDTENEVVQGQAIETVVIRDNQKRQFAIDLEYGVIMPFSGYQLKLVAQDVLGVEIQSTIIKFLDFVGNAQVSGRGGTLLENWHYGLDRAFLPAFKETLNLTDTCTFDNGHVMIINMNNQRDKRYEHVVDDILYPAYSFDCTDSSENTERVVYSEDDQGAKIVSTYSALNDALHYGNVTFDMFFKYLGRPPYSEKIRLRVHYGDEISSDIFWLDGYANFGDELYRSKGSTGLDIVAHELAHGFLYHNSALDSETGGDTRTLHEAFADITAATVKQYYTGQLHWMHGEEIQSHKQRDGSKIITEPGAIPSYLDEHEAGENAYLKIGMISYPFYLLTNKWGIERSYSLFLEAAQSCWGPGEVLLDAAQCVLQTASIRNEPLEDVISAFKAVKIKLFEQGTLAHFKYSARKRSIKFNDNSVSSASISQWHWDFGDGTTSEQQQPTHDYIDGGQYQTKLIVTNSLGEQDTYQRPINVFTDYCSPGIGHFLFSMDTVNINGVVIDSSARDGRYDYSDRIVPVTAGQEINVVVAGDNTGDHKVNWTIWLDLNDDGIFDNSRNSAEIVHNSSSEGGYALDTAFAIPDGSVSGPLRIRITGEFSVVPSPCNLHGENTVDTLIEVQ